MQFMPRMTPQEKREIEEFKRQCEEAEGKPMSEIWADVTIEMTGQTGIPVHIVGDDVEPPAFVREAQRKLNRIAPPPSPAQSRDDLRRLMQELMDGD